AFAAETVLLGLAWFAVVNMAASAVAWAAARVTVASTWRTPSGLVGLRLMPAAAASLVALVFLPSHLWLEPARNEETFGIAWYLLAAIGVALIGRAVMRAVRITCDVRAFVLDTTAATAGVSLVGV